MTTNLNVTRFSDAGKALAVGGSVPAWTLGTITHSVINEQTLNKLFKKVLDKVAMQPFSRSKSPIIHTDISITWPDHLF